MEFKNLFLMAAIAVMPLYNVYAEDIDIDVEDEVTTEETDSIQWTNEGFESAHQANSAMADAFAMRYDVVYYDDGRIESVDMRGGLYLSLRGGAEYRYIPKSGTSYPAGFGELGIGYRTKRIDMRLYAGLGYAEYGKFSDKKAWYISPRGSFEFLYEVAHDKRFEENLFKVGGAVDYKNCRYAFSNDEGEAFFEGGHLGVALVLEYERQFWAKRSGIAVTAKFGLDKEIGNGVKAYGFATSVTLAYRIGVQKKKIFRASDTK